MLRVAGVPFWMQRRSVDLPLQVIGMIGTLTARDFDSEFDDRFRLASFAQLAPDAAARWFSPDQPGKAPAERPVRRVPH